MARYRFPNDRTAFIYQGNYAAVLTPPRTGITVYSNQACTQLADIVDPDTLVAIPASIVYTESGLLPEFLGPDGVIRLWIRVTGATGAGSAIDPTISALFAFQNSGAAYTFTQATPAAVWTIDHPLPYRPSVTVLDSAGYVQETDLYYPPNNPGRVISTASAPFAGTAELT